MDCNNFYVSCERVFRPDRRGVPVIVLSNNGGCAVARSADYVESAQASNVVDSFKSASEGAGSQCVRSKQGSRWLWPTSKSPLRDQLAITHMDLAVRVRGRFFIVRDHQHGLS